MTASDYIITALIVSGTIVVLASVIGVVRLPDPYSRSHALGKGLTLGILLLLVGLWFNSENPTASLKISIAIGFQIVTIPVASHLIGNLYLHLTYMKEDSPPQIPKKQETNAGNSGGSAYNNT